MGSWFHGLFGEEEACTERGATAEAYAATQALFVLEEDGGGPGRGDALVAPNGRRFLPGVFEAPRLSELRARAEAEACRGDEVPLEVLNVVGNVRELHTQPAAAGAVFQVASQFNCLEFVDRSVTPEEGVTRYLFDKSQGPACALACAASTVWRNYFLPLGEEGRSQRGQTASCQLNCLREVQALLGEGLVEVRNGYTSSTSPAAVAAKVGSLSEAEVDEVRAALRVGIQWGAEVTDLRVEHTKNAETRKWEQTGTQCGPVTQVFCSALSIHPSTAALWAPLARLVLEAAYEATLLVAALNHQRGGSRDVYLTLLGAANFHNEAAWIEAAIRRALALLHGRSGLRVHVVHFSASSPQVRAYSSLAAEWSAAAAAAAGSPEGPPVGGPSSPSSSGRGKGKGKGPPPPPKGGGGGRGDG